MTDKRKFESGSSKRKRKEREEKFTQSLKGSINRYVKPTSILDESLSLPAENIAVNDENLDTEVLFETVIVDNNNLNHENVDETLRHVVDNVVNDEFVTENQDVNNENLDILLDPGKPPVCWSRL
ncbi:hypothetical protein AgCh_024910 [Apium graveolens]